MSIKVNREDNDEITVGDIPLFSVVKEDIENIENDHIVVSVKIEDESVNE